MCPREVGFILTRELDQLDQLDQLGMSLRPIQMVYSELVQAGRRAN